MSTLTTGERVISRARSLMENGKARSWSHAIQKAAETLEEPTDQPKPSRQSREKESAQ